MASRKMPHSARPASSESNAALQAPLTQTVHGITYVFKSWSDGGAATHDISSPSSTTAYIANYIAAADVFLADMAFSGKATNSWGPIERNMSVGQKKANDGQVIKLDGVSYSNGLGVNATSSVSFNLSGDYLQFVSDIGIDDEVGNKGSVVISGIRRRYKTIRQRHDDR